MKFSIGEVAEIVVAKGAYGHFKGLECTIVKPVLNDLETGTIKYEVDVHGERPSNYGIDKFHIDEYGLRKKKPPEEKLGDWAVIQKETGWNPSEAKEKDNG